MEDTTRQLTIHYASLGRMTIDTWPGSVTAKSNSVDFNSIQDSLDEYYVQSDDHSATRCIDGRHDAQLDE